MSLPWRMRRGVWRDPYTVDDYSPDSSAYGAYGPPVLRKPMAPPQGGRGPCLIILLVLIAIIVLLALGLGLGLGLQPTEVTPAPITTTTTPAPPLPTLPPFLNVTDACRDTAQSVPCQVTNYAWRYNTFTGNCEYVRGCGLGGNYFLSYDDCDAQCGSGKAPVLGTAILSEIRFDPIWLDMDDPNTQATAEQFCNELLQFLAIPGLECEVIELRPGSLVVDFRLTMGSSQVDPYGNNDLVVTVQDTISQASLDGTFKPLGSVVETAFARPNSGIVTKPARMNVALQALKSLLSHLKRLIQSAVSFIRLLLSFIQNLWSDFDMQSFMNQLEGNIPTLDGFCSSIQLLLDLYGNVPLEFLTKAICRLMEHIVAWLAQLKKFVTTAINQIIEGLPSTWKWIIRYFEWMKNVLAGQIDQILKYIKDCLLRLKNGISVTLPPKPKELKEILETLQSLHSNVLSFLENICDLFDYLPKQLADSRYPDEWGNTKDWMSRKKTEFNQNYTTYSETFEFFIEYGLTYLEPKCLYSALCEFLGDLVGGLRACLGDITRYISSLFDTVSNNSVINFYNGIIRDAFDYLTKLLSRYIEFFQDCINDMKEKPDDPQLEKPADILHLLRLLKSCMNQILTMLENFFAFINHAIERLANHLSGVFVNELTNWMSMVQDIISNAADIITHIDVIFKYLVDAFDLEFILDEICRVINYVSSWLERMMAALSGHIDMLLADVKSDYYLVEVFINICFDVKEKIFDKVYDLIELIKSCIKEFKPGSEDCEIPKPPDLDIGLGLQMLMTHIDLLEDCVTKAIEYTGIILNWIKDKSFISSSTLTDIEGFTATLTSELIAFPDVLERIRIIHGLMENFSFDCLRAEICRLLDSIRDWFSYCHQLMTQHVSALFNDNIAAADQDDRIFIEMIIRVYGDIWNHVMCKIEALIKFVEECLKPLTVDHDTDPLEKPDDMSTALKMVIELMRKLDQAAREIIRFIKHILSVLGNAFEIDIDDFTEELLSHLAMMSELMNPLNELLDLMAANVDIECLWEEICTALEDVISWMRGIHDLLQSTVESLFDPRVEGDTQTKVLRRVLKDLFHKVEEMIEYFITIILDCIKPQPDDNEPPKPDEFSARMKMLMDWLDRLQGMLRDLIHLMNYTFNVIREILLTNMDELKGHIDDHIEDIEEVFESMANWSNGFNLIFDLLPERLPLDCLMKEICRLLEEILPVLENLKGLLQKEILKVFDVIVTENKAIKLVIRVFNIAVDKAYDKVCDTIDFITECLLAAKEAVEAPVWNLEILPDGLEILKDLLQVLKDCIITICQAMRYLVSLLKDIVDLSDDLLDEIEDTMLALELFGSDLQECCDELTDILSQAGEIPHDELLQLSDQLLAKINNSVIPQLSSLDVLVTSINAIQVDDYIGMMIKRLLLDLLGKLQEKMNVIIDLITTDIQDVRDVLTRKPEEFPQSLEYSVEVYREKSLAYQALNLDQFRQDQAEHLDDEFDDLLAVLEDSDKQNTGSFADITGFLADYKSGATGVLGSIQQEILSMLIEMINMDLYLKKMNEYLAAVTPGNDEISNVMLQLLTLSEEFNSCEGSIIGDVNSVQYQISLL